MTDTQPLTISCCINKPICFAAQYGTGLQSSKNTLAGLGVFNTLTVLSTLHFLGNLRKGTQSICPRQAFPAMCNVTFKLIGPIRRNAENEL
jgi:hypothetical protein